MTAYEAYMLGQGYYSTPLGQLAGTYPQSMGELTYQQAVQAYHNLQQPQISTPQKTTKSKLLLLTKP